MKKDKENEKELKEEQAVDKETCVQQDEDQCIENKEEVKKKKKFSLSGKDNFKQKNEELQKRVEEINDKYLRLYSEFDNYRKRTMKERLDLLKTASADTIASMLTILDDFERSVKAAEDISDIEVIKEGNILTYNKLKNIFNQKGLEEIKAMGEVFNTDLHEAITNIPAPTDDLKGKVVDVTEKGYMIHGKVIRFAKVVVGC